MDLSPNETYALLGVQEYSSVVFEHGVTVTTPYGYGLFCIRETKYQERRALFFADSMGNITWLSADKGYINDCFSVTIDGGVIKVTNVAVNNLAYSFSLKKYI